MSKLKKDALQYHAKGKKGKIEVIPTKPHNTQYDLSLAYSPGVAYPCTEIQKDKRLAYEYTGKGNLVAVISNGTAVLGLGDIGPEASKPVMEGKSLLFKIFAGIDSFDIEVDESKVEDFVKVVKAIAPTFGGINLEDIKAPEAFEIERRLIEELDIPVMHDDQHGTAIISSAALINALKIANKDISKIQLVINGAGSSAISCAKLYMLIGVRPEHIVMCDSKGVLHSQRKDLTKYKEQMITYRDLKTLEQAVVGADAFIGLSRGNVLSPEMLSTMAPNPIVFAMANPTPEIDYNLALKTRKDIIMATGRSDHPNQVNNVLGFPYIFRGALDVRASKINEEMKKAAVEAIAELAQEPVPEQVIKAYGLQNMGFGRDYIIPKPFDPRLITEVSMAVAKAAMETGVARESISDWRAYEESLVLRMNLDSKLMRMLVHKAKIKPQRVVFTEGNYLSVIKAANHVHEHGLAIPILLGDKETIQAMMEEFGLSKDIQIVDPKSKEQADFVKKFADQLWEKRCRSGMNKTEAYKKVLNRDYFGGMMVQNDMADALITGYSKKYSTAFESVLHTVGSKGGFVAALTIFVTSRGPLFLADTALNPDPTEEELEKIVLMASALVRRFGEEPRVALISYSNFGSSKLPTSRKVRRITQKLHKKYPHLCVDGEVQADLALNSELLKKAFPFSKLADKPANTLIFPNLDSGNTAYKLIKEIYHPTMIGPVLLGVNKAVHIIPMNASYDEIVNLCTFAVVDAQKREKHYRAK